MIKELKIKTLVVSAAEGAQFQPSKCNHYWLDKHGIVPGDQIKESSSFSPQMAEVISSDLQILVLDDQVQMRPVEGIPFEDLISRCVCFFENIDEVEISNVGFILNWFLKDKNADFKKISKDLFLTDRNPVTSWFDGDSTYYGNYFSKTLDDDVRLRLDIKIVVLVDGKTKESEECLLCQFNFQQDPKVLDKKRSVIDFIKNYKKWYSISNELTDKLL